MSLLGGNAVTQNIPGRALAAPALGTKPKSSTVYQPFTYICLVGRRPAVDEEFDPGHRKQEGDGSGSHPRGRRTPPEAKDKQHPGERPGDEIERHHALEIPAKNRNDAL